MRNPLPLLLLLTAAAGRTGCGGAPITSPSPAPTPTPTPVYPKAAPNGTAFENLPLVRSLELASGRSTILVALGGSVVSQNGRISGRSGWQYVFSETIAGVPQLYRWTVFDTGTITEQGPDPDLQHLDFTEIGPVLQIDSDVAVALGRQYGAQAFVDRYPAALVSAGLSFQGLLPTWELRYGELPPAGPLCNVYIFLNAQTGALLARDLSCLQLIGSKGNDHVP